MKLKLLFYAWPVMALLSTSCSDDNSDIAPKTEVTLQSTLAGGEWEIASYVDSHPTPLVQDQGSVEDREDLNDLPNYSFTFNPKDMIIASAYGNTDPVGVWVVSSNETTGEQTLDLNYPYKPLLKGLSGSWTVTELKENEVSLKLHDELWGGDDRIVFRKITDGGQTPGGNN